jgi:hypothetical protein
MKKLFAAYPVLVLAGLWFAQSCSNSDQGTGTGMGGNTGTGGSASGMGGSGNPGLGGMTVGSGGTNSGAGGSTVGWGGLVGRGGTVGTGGTQGGTGGANLLDVASVLNGQMLLGPCKATASASVCDTREPGAACPGNADRALAGILTTNHTVTLGGTTGTPYTITMHIQGVVESKQYTGGADANSAAQSPAANGFCVGGTPTTVDNYNVYMLRVTNPGATTHTDYFFNSLEQPPAGSTQRGPGVSNHTTYGIDYVTGPIRAQGGATILLVAGDSNCQMIKNCGPMENSGNVCAAPIIIPNVDPVARSANPTFDFTQTPYNGQWVVMVVKTVTSP